MSKLIHILDVPGITEENAAFISYVVGQHSGLTFDKLMFVENEQKFAAVSTSYVLPLNDKKSPTSMEFWLIAKEGKQMGMAWRMVNSGMIINDSIGFINFIVRPYDLASVLDAIKSIKPFRVLH